MGLSSRALLLLSAAVFFTIADTQDFSKNEEFEGLFESFVEDLEKLIAKYRRISMTGGALKSKQWDKTGSSASPTEQTITFVTKIYESSTDPSISIAGYNTMPVETSTKETASSYTVISGSTSGYITTEPATAKQTVTSTSGTLSQTAHSSSSEGYSAVDPMTEDTAISTSKSDGSCETPSSSSSVSTAAEEQTATQKSDGSSADSTCTPDIYSIAAPEAEEQMATLAPKSDSSCVAPSSSTVAPAAEPREVSESACSFTESRDPPSINHPLRVGSIRGIPGVHYPNYTDIPITDFSCLDKPFVPGFYADVDAGCQVFHACWSHEQETFLCPVGTTFNQALLACDYWYTNDCSSAQHHYSVNMGDTGLGTSEERKYDYGIMSLIFDVILRSRTLDPTEVTYTLEKELDCVSALTLVSKFLPVKKIVSLYTESTEPYYETTQSFEDKDTSTYHMLPKVSVLISHPYDSQIVFDDSFEDAMEEAVRQTFEEAFQQAYKDIDDYVTPLLQAEPLNEDLQSVKEFNEAYLKRMLSHAKDKTFIPSYVDLSTWPGEGKTYEDKAQQFRHGFVSLMKCLAQSFVQYRNSSRSEDAAVPNAILMDSETTQQADLDESCEDSLEESVQQTYIETNAPLSNPMDSETTPQADLDESCEDSLEESVLQTYIETVTPLANPMDSETTPQTDLDESCEDNLEESVLQTYIETVTPLTNAMDSETTTPADLEESCEEAWKSPFDSLEESDQQTYTEAVQLANGGQSVTERPRLATVAPLTKLNPRFITKPVELKPVEHEVARKSSVSKKPMKWRNTSGIARETNEALKLNYDNFVKSKAKSFKSEL